MLKRVMLAVSIVLGTCGLASGQSVDPEARSAAKELIAVMRAADQVKAIIPALLRVLKPAIVQGRPEVERDYDQLQPHIVEVFNSRMNEIIEAMAIVYARHLTAEELRGITQFMRMPAGRKFVDKMPIIAQESMLVGQKFGESAASELRTRMIDELRKRGHKI